jgi:hypothetical protein
MINPEELSRLAAEILAAPSSLMDSWRQARSFRKLRKLAEFGNVEAQEALCRAAIHMTYTPARETAVLAKYAPREPAERALFYFLTEQWERYGAADPDRGNVR